jgi:hypothetical protein
MKYDPEQRADSCGNQNRADQDWGECRGDPGSDHGHRENDPSNVDQVHGELCKTSVITSQGFSQESFVPKAGDTPDEITGNGFSGR